MSGERKKVRVSCSHPGGLELHVYELGPDDGSGHRPMVPKGAPIKLKGPSTVHAGTSDPGARLATPVVNDDIDAEVMQAWLDQNVNSPLAELLTVHDDDPKPKDEAE